MKALLMGKQVKLGRNLYGCADDNSVGLVDSMSFDHVLTFPDGPSINHLIKKSEEMPEADIIALAASMALQEINEEKRKHVG